MTRAIRFAVVGLGPFAQAVIVPAIHGQRGAAVTALIGGSTAEREQLGRRFRVSHLCDAAEYDDLLGSGAVEAVHVAAATELHADLVERAARHGVHVVCERPLARTEAECHRMIDACERAGVSLLVASRLPYQAGNLHALELARHGAIGEPRLVAAVMAGPPGDAEVLDRGAAAIAMARRVFEAEPLAVLAHRLGEDAAGPAGATDGVAALLHFDRGRLASLVWCPSTIERSRCEIIGRDGTIEIDAAFACNQAMAVRLAADGTRRHRAFRRNDQVAAEIQYFVRCLRKRVAPEPAGADGLAETRVLAAIRAAADGHREVDVPPPTPPAPGQDAERAPTDRSDERGGHRALAMP